MKKLSIIIVLFWALGCKQEQAPMNISETDTDTTALNNDLNITNTQVTLLPEARDITANWLAYITAESELNNFGNYTVNDIISNATPIAEIMNSLRETVPEEFKTKAVQTRLSVLYTKAKVLEHLSNRRNNQTEEITATAEELPVEFNNFKIQLNELYLKTLEDFEQELDELETDEDTTTSINRNLPETENNSQ